MYVCMIVYVCVLFRFGVFEFLTAVLFLPATIAMKEQKSASVWRIPDGAGKLRECFFGFGEDEVGCGGGREGGKARCV